MAGQHGSTPMAACSASPQRSRTPRRRIEKTSWDVEKRLLKGFHFSWVMQIAQPEDPVGEMYERYFKDVQLERRYRDLEVQYHDLKKNGRGGKRQRRRRLGRTAALEVASTPDDARTRSTFVSFGEYKRIYHKATEEWNRDRRRSNSNTSSQLAYGRENPDSSSSMPRPPGSPQPATQSMPPEQEKSEEYTEQWESSEEETDNEDQTQKKSEEHTEQWESCEEETDNEGEEETDNEEEQTTPSRPTSPLKDEPRNPYEILGVSSACSFREMSLAYRKKALIQHPDKGGTVASFQDVLWAYERLKARLQDSR